MFRRLSAVGALSLAALAPAHAQVVYDQIKTDDVLQGHIGMGALSRDLPLPPGRWRVLGTHTETAATIGKENSSLRGSLDYVTVVFKNEDPGNVMPLMAYTFTPRTSNIDWSNRPCVADAPDGLVDTLDTTSPTAALFGCATAKTLGQFRTLVRGAHRQDNPWARMVLGAAERIADELPEQVVLLTVRANAYRGRNYMLSFFARQEAAWNHTGYTLHLQQWMRSTGKAVLDVAANQKASIAAALPYIPQNAAGTPPVMQRPAAALPVNAPTVVERYERTPVAADTFAAALRKCVSGLPQPLPWPENNIPKAMVESFSATTTDTNLFVASKGISVCVPRSAQGYPVFALETLQGTATPVGVPDAIAAQWLQKAAIRLATTGNSTVAYRLPQGAYQVVTHAVRKDQIGVLRYYTRHYPAGTPASDLSADEILQDPSLTAVDVSGLDAQGVGIRKQLF